MKTITYHIKAIEETFKALSQGKFLVFFLPGFVLTASFMIYTYYFASREGFLGIETGISFIDWIMDLFESIFSFIVEQIYLFIVLTALSPFFTMLGDKFDTYLTGRSFISTWKKFFKDILRMCLVVIVMIFLEYFFMLFYWIITLPFDIPVMDDIVYTLIAAFFFGFAFFDFALERYEMNVGKTISYAFKNPLSMTITGGIFLLIYKIPIVGVPLAPVLTVMISTVVYLYLEQKLPRTAN